MMKSRTRAALYFGLLLACIAGIIGIGYYAGKHPKNDGDHAMPSAHAADGSVDRLDGGKPTKKLWVCPMHPEILRDHPSTCPICGMDLVAADSGHEHDSSGVQVDTASQQRIGVRLASVERQTLSREVQTYGNVAIDETSMFNISPKVEGWVRKLHVNAVGQRVRAGQILYETYSPDLVQRQRDYIDIFTRKDQLTKGQKEIPTYNVQMLAALEKERILSRAKLLNTDVSEKMLAEIEKTRLPVDIVPVYAPKSSFVTQIGAREGSYIAPMTNVLSFADASSVWIDIVLYPDQLAWVKEGDEATVQPSRSDQPRVKGRLKFVSPTVDSATRTVRARFTVSNAHQLFRPGEFVDVLISASPRQALALPRSAVMRTGRGNRVMLAGGDGHFTPVSVETGVESGNLVEITDGLQEGMQVAVNGQFLLDAAASLNDAAQRMQGDH